MPRGRRDGSDLAGGGMKNFDFLGDDGVIEALLGEIRYLLKTS